MNRRESLLAGLASVFLPSATRSQGPELKLFRRSDDGRAMPVETSQLKMNDRFIMIQTDPDGAIFHIDFYKAEVDAFLHDGQWDIFMHEIEPYLFWLGRDMPPIKSA